MGLFGRRKADDTRRGEGTSGKRFERIYNQGSLRVAEIWLDRETGVHYLFQSSGNAGGLTPLLDREGQPVIKPVPYKGY